MIAVAAFALVPSSGFVIATCTARVAVIALGGTGGWWQLAGVRGRHPDEAVDGVRSVWRVLVRSCQSGRISNRSTTCPTTA